MTIIDKHLKLQQIVCNHLKNIQQYDFTITDDKVIKFFDDVFKKKLFISTLFM